MFDRILTMAVAGLAAMLLIAQPAHSDEKIDSIEDLVATGCANVKQHMEWLKNDPLNEDLVFYMADSMEVEIVKKIWIDLDPLAAGWTPYHVSYLMIFNYDIGLVVAIPFMKKTGCSDKETDLLIPIRTYEKGYEFYTRSASNSHGT